MILYDGRKYSCLSCIRGHRSSSCDHRDRPLLQVRRRGRPIGDSTTRLAILPNTNGTICSCEGDCESDGACGDGKCVLVRTIDVASNNESEAPSPTILPSLPSGSFSESSTNWHRIAKPRLRMQRARKASKDDDRHDSPIPAETRRSVSPADSDDTVGERIFAEKFVFISVGNGLYRKEPRKDICEKKETLPGKSCCKSEPKNDLPSRQTASEEPNSDAQSSTPNMPPRQINVGSDSQPNPQNTLLTDLSNHHISEHSLADPGFIDQHFDNMQGVHNNLGLAAPSAATNGPWMGSEHAPMIIAPMNYDGQYIENLGMSGQESAEMWPSQNDIEFAPICVIPGQCECGPECACDNCATHGHIRQRM